MVRAAALAAALLPLVAVAAPVPVHLMPKPEIQLRHNPLNHPLASSYEITIRNSGGAELQVWTDRPYGIATFLDCEVANEKSERVSRLFQWNTPADQGATNKLVETIPAGKSYVTTLQAFSTVNEKSLAPGKYKVRVRFQYRDQNVVTEWVSVDVSESQIRTKNLVP